MNSAILFALLESIRSFTAMIVEGTCDQGPNDICKSVGGLGVVANSTNIDILLKLLKEKNVEKAFVYGYEDYIGPMILYSNGTLVPYIKDRITSKFALCIGQCPCKPKVVGTDNGKPCCGLKEEKPCCGIQEAVSHQKVDKPCCGQKEVAVAHQKVEEPCCGQKEFKTCCNQKVKEPCCGRQEVKPCCGQKYDKPCMAFVAGRRPEERKSSMIQPPEPVVRVLVEYCLLRLVRVVVMSDLLLASWLLLMK